MPELFEQEVAMEKRSSWGPLLLVMALVGCIVGGIGYYAFEMKKGISQEQATAIINEQLKERTASVHFRTGKIQSGMAEQAKDPHYKLLAKGGYLEVKDVSWDTINATLTPAGEKAFSAIPGFKKWENPDKTWSYEVPVATRELVKIDTIELSGPALAKVVYTWKWVPNTVGELFDASGSAIKSFNTWDRGKLIEKYAADYYHSEPRNQTLRLTKGDKGWKISND